MSGNEWLNIQDIFVLFVGRWIVVYTGGVVAAGVAASILSILYRRAVHVKITNWQDNE